MMLARGVRANGPRSVREPHRSRRPPDARIRRTGRRSRRLPGRRLRAVLPKLPACACRPTPMPSRRFGTASSAPLDSWASWRWCSADPGRYRRRADSPRVARVALRCDRDPEVPRRAAARDRRVSTPPRRPLLGLAGSLAGVAIATAMLAIVPRFLSAGSSRRCRSTPGSPAAALARVLRWAPASRCSFSVAAALGASSRPAAARASAATRSLCASELVRARGGRPCPLTGGVFGAAYAQSGSASIAAGIRRRDDRRPPAVARRAPLSSSRAVVARLAQGPGAGSSFATALPPSRGRERARCPRSRRSAWACWSSSPSRSCDGGLTSRLRADLPKDAPNVFLGRHAADPVAAGAVDRGGRGRDRDPRRPDRQRPPRVDRRRRGGGACQRSARTKDAQQVDPHARAEPHLPRRATEGQRRRRRRSSGATRSTPRSRSSAISPATWASTSARSSSTTSRAFRFELTVTSFRTVDWKSVRHQFLPDRGARRPRPSRRRCGSPRRASPAGREQALQDRLAARGSQRHDAQGARDRREGRDPSRARRVGIRILGGFAITAGIAILAGAVGATASRRGREVAPAQDAWRDEARRHGDLRRRVRVDRSHGRHHRDDRRNGSGLLRPDPRHGDRLGVASLVLAGAPLADGRALGARRHRREHRRAAAPADRGVEGGVGETGGGLLTSGSGGSNPSSGAKPLVFELGRTG